MNSLKENNKIQSGLKWYKRWWVIVIFLLVLFIAVNFILLATGSFLNNSLDTSSNQEKVDELQLLVNTETDPYLGNFKDAKIRIIEFADFQCPFCQSSFPVIREVLNKYSDDIFYVYRDFPVVDSHPQAFKAAEAAQCAYEQDKFWPMHDKLFINQSELEAEKFSQYALEIGLDVNQFNNCLNSGKYTAEVTQDLEDGLSLGVRGTPTFFINGYKVSGNLSKANWETIIEAVITAAKNN